MKIDIRPEKESDFKAIYNTNVLAFGGTEEAVLVGKLRKTPNFISELSLVAKFNNKTVGHILFYPIEIAGDGNTAKTLALAPMSVLPQYQRKGIGGKMVKVGLSKAKKLGYDCVIVLGHEKYYPKFGFQPASKWGIKCPFEAPDASFMALELTPGVLTRSAGTVVYPKEFNEA